MVDVQDIVVSVGRVLGNEVEFPLTFFQGIALFGLAPGVVPGAAFDAGAVVGQAVDGALAVLVVIVKGWGWRGRGFCCFCSCGCFGGRGADVDGEFVEAVDVFVGEAALFCFCELVEELTGVVDGVLGFDEAGFVFLVFGVAFALGGLGVYAGIAVGVFGDEFGFTNEGAEAVVVVFAEFIFLVDAFDHAVGAVIGVLGGGGVLGGFF